MTRPAAQAGFMLLEVLVAFALLTAAASALLAAFGVAVQADNQAAFLTRATLLASAKLAALGVDAPLEAGASSGTFPNGYVWRAAVRLDHRVGTGGGIGVFSVTLGVSDPDATSRQVSLSSVQLGRPVAP